MLLGGLADVPARLVLLAACIRGDLRLGADEVGLELSLHLGEVLLPLHLLGEELLVWRSRRLRLLCCLLRLGDGLVEHGLDVLRDGSDGLWNVPYGRLPRLLDAAVHAGPSLAQFLAGRLFLAPGSGESSVFVVIRRP